MNPHALAGTSPSSWRVCQFRHSDVTPDDSGSAIRVPPGLASTAKRTGCVSLEQKTKSNRSKGKNKGSQHGDPVQVLLNHSRTGGLGSNASAEHVR